MELLKKYPAISPAEEKMLRWETQWGALSVEEKAEAAEFYRQAFYAVFCGDLPAFQMDVEQAKGFQLLYILDRDIPKA